MTDEKILDKIRKLMALGQSPNENEAQRALELASSMMLRHGISEDQIGVLHVKKASAGDVKTQTYRWHGFLARAAANLYFCRIVEYREVKQFRFVGREENTKAAEDTFEFLVSQVEGLYKVNLPKGMSVSARAEYRRTFKDACSHRVWVRAFQFVQSLQEDKKAVETTGSTALVVTSHIDTLMKEIDDFFGEAGVRTIKSKKTTKIKQSRGSEDGFRAASQVNLHRTVK